MGRTRRIDHLSDAQRSRVWTYYLAAERHVGGKLKPGELNKIARHYGVSIGTIMAIIHEHEDQEQLKQVEEEARVQAQRRAKGQILELSRNPTSFNPIFKPRGA